MAIDYNAEYNNARACPTMSKILAGMARTPAPTARRRSTKNAPNSNVPTEIRRARSSISFSRSGANAPIAMFIHGGYWRALQPSAFSQVAAGLNARGVTVALAGYDLCPQVSIGESSNRCGRLAFTCEALRQAHCRDGSFGRRASRRLHDRDRLAIARRAGGPCPGRYGNFRRVRSRANDRDRDER